MFETQGRTRNRTRDLPKKGSAFITSSDHWTKNLWGGGGVLLERGMPVALPHAPQGMVMALVY